MDLGGFLSQVGTEKTAKTGQDRKGQDKTGEDKTKKRQDSEQREGHETSEPNREPWNRVRLTGNRCEPEPGLFKDQGPKYIPLYPFFTKKLIVNEFPPSKNRFFSQNPEIFDHAQPWN